MSWKLVYTRHALKDAKKIQSVGLRRQVEMVLDILRDNPFQNPPSCEKLVGDLSGAYSRRINFKHRLVYQVIKESKIVKVLRMWTHYD